MAALAALAALPLPQMDGFAIRAWSYAESGGDRSVLRRLKAELAALAALAAFRQNGSGHEQTTVRG